MQALAPSHGGSGSVLREVESVPSIDTKGLFAWLIGRSFLSREVCGTEPASASRFARTPCTCRARKPTERRCRGKNYACWGQMSLHSFGFLPRHVPDRQPKEQPNLNQQVAQPTKA